MDDLTELQSRVAAAQERLQQSAEEERRYGLRLNDIVAIVEGSLARQRDEVEKLKAEVVDLRTVLGRTSGERDEAKSALIQAHTALSAAQARLGQREVQNEQLRRMLMELLAAIESRKSNAVPDVVRRLESGIKSIMKEQTAEPEGPTAAADSAAPRPAASPARGRLTIVTSVAQVDKASGRLALAAQPESEEAAIAEEIANEDLEELAAETASEPEAVEDIAMSEAGDIVTEPEAEAAEPIEAEATENPQEQKLVNALLDAERKLIEAGASGGASTNSPVAEIIRRLSQHSRDISEPAAKS
jgi:hypothetical protein